MGKLHKKQSNIWKKIKRVFKKVFSLKNLGLAVMTVAVVAMLGLSILPYLFL